MARFANVLGAVGDTPMIELTRVTDGLPITLLGKVEYLNPGGSIKDRIAVAMVEDAERKGILTPSGTIVEATAGNTGVGLALAAAVKGYRCVLVLPDKMSSEKVDVLRAYGAEVVITPSSVAPDSPESYNGVADRLAREISGAFRPSQFANDKNPEAHYLTTGPEIWRDCGGRIDAFVAGVGTGGTISGVGRFLKERDPEVTIVAADPEGSIISGDAPHSYQVEGIGEDFVPATYTRQAVDTFVRVSDAESFGMARRLAREEGLLVGGSAGTAVAGALKYSQRLPEGSVVVALLPDTGRNYLSKFLSDSWMQENGFTEPSHDRATAGDVLRAKRDAIPLVAVKPTDPSLRAVEVLKQYDISQIPVIDEDRVVGTVNEVILAKSLHDGLDLSVTDVGAIMGAPPPQVDEHVDIAEPYRLLLAGHGAVVVTRRGVPAGLLARIDLVEFWSARVPSAILA